MAGRVPWAIGAGLGLAIHLSVAASPASAQNYADAVEGRPDAQEIVVATRVVPPFVMEEKDGRLTGFSADLWRAIAAESGLKSSFKVYDTLPELLAAVQFSENPVGISAISVTADREQTLEFSQPMYRSGMQIMAPAPHNGALDTLRSAFSIRLLEAIGLFLLALLVPAHIAWGIHRSNPKSTWNVSRSYWPGILEAFYWSGEKMIGTASGAPGGHFGRLFNNLWSFLCVMVLASLTALIASALTIRSLRNDINGPEDLAGKRVATVQGSTSAAYLRDLGASVAEYPDFDGAVAALAKREEIGGHSAPVALVYDAPIVLYFINNDSERNFVAVGSPFRAENYGIAFPLDSKIRHTVDEALLKLRENGTFDQIRDKWFGKSLVQN
jgi:polar amino acid transport system substrate-binding protein